MKNLVFLTIILCLAITTGYSQNDKIIINKKPRTTTTQNQYPSPNTTKTNTQNQQPTQQNRTQHQNTQQLENLELRYSVSELGQTAKHNHYRISGHIYSNLNEPIFCHNRRIVLFKIDNWDSGFLNDDLQSVDGYATQYRLNPQGNLFVFGNSTVREFAFDFKVKKGLQHRVQSQIIADWAPLADYEKYLLLEYSMLNGTWNMEENTEAKFELQFSAQGDQLAMKDIFGTPVAWTKSEGNTYIRKIGTIQTPTQTTQQPTQQPTQDSNSSSNYPSGGYLGNGTNNQNQQPTNTQNNSSGNNYPSGGYLGDGNSNNQQGNTTGATNNPAGSYSSVLEIVDRNTIRYRNSEGIVCLLKKTVN